MGLHQRFDEDQVQNVYRFIYRHVGNREEAEDLTEQTFIRAVRAAPTMVAEPSSVHSTDTMLRRAACAVVTAYLGQVYRCYLAASDDKLGDKLGDEPDDASATAQRIFARLPERDRELLTYRLLRNFSLAETATRMRMSMNDALALQWSALTNAARIAGNEPADETPHRLEQCAAGDSAR
jgi:RNA polymerase sigma-70 factor (ECF subfamily)